MRAIFSSQVHREGDRLIYTVRGSGFLKHMVRNIVGALIEAGKGNLQEADLNEMLATNHPTPNAQRPTAAPSKGLFLIGVEYNGILPL